MTDDPIPPTPSAENYAAQLAANADEAQFERTNPLPLFLEWLAEARRSEPNDSNAMALATVDENGLPDCRMVLLKGVDARGFAFYTNRESAKGLQLTGQPRASLLFHWKSLRRQVRIRGAATPVGDDEADAYFASRAKESRIGAWASAQSRPLENRETLEAAVQAARDRFGGSEPPRPDYWIGWRVEPVQIEFWRDRAFRLHDRLRFDRDGDGWRRTRLYP